MRAGNWGDNDYAAYSSVDLANWVLENPQILPSHKRPRGTYFRPKVLHAPQNIETERFVLWGNWVNMTEGGTSAMYFSAVSAQPQGPYSIKHWNISMGTGWWANGDFNVFVDDDQQGYIIYHSYGCPLWPGVPRTPCEGADGSHAVDLLTGDFTSSTRKTSGLFDIRPSEAPIMFRRKDMYYVLTATGCGFCPEGSDSKLYIAPSPMGPFNYTGLDLNPCRNSSIPNCGEDPVNAPHVVQAQQAFALRLPPDVQGREQWVWAADAWWSAPDSLKAHEMQPWAPLRFGPDDMPLPFQNLSSFVLDI